MSPSTKKMLVAAALGVAAYQGARALLRRSRWISLSNRVAIVVGGSRGLGLAIARRLAAEGAKVAICARTKDDLSAAAKELRDLTPDILSFEVDVREPAEVAQMVEDVRSAWGEVDLLFNVAGVMMVGPMEEMTVDDFQEAMQTNYFGPLHTMLAIGPSMRARGFGRIVNIASIGGKQAVPHMAAYDGSKFALVGLSKAVRTEFAKDGVLVTTACPTLMRTGSPRNAEFKGRHREEYAWFSIGGSLPFFSVSAEKAAKQVVEACQYGDAECFVSNLLNPPVLAATWAPQLTQEVLEIINRLLPGPGGIGKHAARGYESQSWFSPSWLTALQDQAAKEYNQLRPRPR